MYTSFIFLIGYFIIYFTGNAQSFEIESINLKKSSTIVKITQDEIGFIWIATLNGLYRYDGTDFAEYNHIETDTLSLSNSVVIDMVFDKTGKIWVATQFGLNLFDPVTGKTNRLKSINNQISDMNISSLYMQSDSILWIGTLNGLNKLNINTTEVIQYNNSSSPPKISSNKISNIFVDNQSRIWVGTNNSGLFLYNQQTDSFKKILLDKKKASIGDVKKIFLDDMDRINVLYTYSGMYIYSNTDSILSPRTTNIPTSTKYLNSYYCSDSYIWLVYQENKVNHLAKLNDNKFHKLSSIHPELKNLTVNHIFEDKSHTIWVATSNGIKKIIPKLKHFHNYQSRSGESDTENYVYPILKDSKDNTWIGTEMGINNFTGNGYVKTLSNMIKNKVQSLLEDHNNNIWISQWSSETPIIRYNLNSGQISSIKYNPTDSNNISDNRVLSIYQDKLKQIWIGTAVGLNQYNYSEQTFTKYYTHKEDTTTLSSNAILAITEDKAGNLWVGTDNGLNRYNQETKHFEQFFNQYNNIIIHLAKIKDDMLIGTYGSGLIRLNIENSSYQKIDELKGLTNNLIVGIAVDKKDQIWVSTFNGISKVVYSDTGYTINNYNTEHGIAASEFNQSAVFYDQEENNVYFGHVKGLLRFNPDSIVTDTHQSVTVITDFQKYYEPVELNRSVSYTDTLKISYLDRVISFKFATLYFRSKQKKFKYKLHNFDAQWITTNSNTATFTNLDGGEYIFEVKGVNSDGIWSSKSDKLILIVKPPYWETVWFRLTATLITAFIIGLYFYSRINRLKGEKKYLEKQVEIRTEKLKQQTVELKKLDKLKTDFIANITHEFRTPLTLIISPLELIIRKSDDAILKGKLSSIQENAERLLGLINQLLDISKLENKSMGLNLTLVDMNQFISKVAKNLEHFDSDKKIQINVIEKNVNCQTMLDLDKFEKILFNLLSNAIKFSSKIVRITITLEQVDSDFYQISIKDNGKGISPETLPNIFDRFYQAERVADTKLHGTGIGLALTKELVELHNGSIYAKSVLGIGTEFIINFPKIMDAV